MSPNPTEETVRIVKYKASMKESVPSLFGSDTV